MNISTISNKLLTFVVSVGVDMSVEWDVVG